jgi:hypothetical protein
MMCKNHVATVATVATYCHVAGKLKPNEFEGAGGVAMIAMSFLKVVEEIYIKGLSENDGKRGNHGKTVMGTVLNECHHSARPII